MNRRSLAGLVTLLSLLAGLGFVVIAVHEFDYAGSHPYAYGPAKVIAWGAVAGSVLASAVAIAGLALRRD